MKERERTFFPGTIQICEDIFDQPKSSELKTEKKVLEKHLKDTFSDPNQYIPLEHNNNLVWPVIPKVRFEMKLPRC